MTRFQLARAGDTAIESNLTEDPMDIGKPQRVVRVEPLEEPVPRETPAPAPEREPEKVPAAPTRD
ncbi:MAG TPA: hypothetical protein VIU86_10495 [Gaiellaceae bacterium]